MLGKIEDRGTFRCLRYYLRISKTGVWGYSRSIRQKSINMSGQRLKGLFFCLLVIGLLCSCSYSYTIALDPPDALLFINAERAAKDTKYSTSEKTLTILARRDGYEDYQTTYSLSDSFSTAEIKIQLIKKKYRVEIRLLNSEATLSIDNSINAKTPYKGVLAYGLHTVTFRKPELPEYSVFVDVQKDASFVFRYQTEKLPLRQVGIYPCGSAPKQVNFSKDNRFLFITLLNGEGFQIFDLKAKEMLHSVKVGKWPQYKGFAEGLFIEKPYAYLLSQMTTGTVFEYDVHEDGSVSYYRAMATEGVYCKYMAYCVSLDLLAVSNWCSNDISLISYSTGKVVKKLKGFSTPRGVAFSRDGKHLYIANFDGGNFYKYRTDTWQEEARFSRPNAAMRHIVLSDDQKKCFVSDMFNFVVYELNTEDLKLIHTYSVYFNPNTIDLSSDGRFLFVSCRGPNNSTSYLLRSPKNGKVMIFDTIRKTLVATIEGGNQPTGLDVSSDDKYLVFSNFLDDNFEIYDLSELGKEEN
jgi:DNA-binding beta-propeller fold protein YncE